MQKKKKLVLIKNNWLSLIRKMYNYVKLDTNVNTWVFIIYLCILL